MMMMLTCFDNCAHVGCFLGQILHLDFQLEQNTYNWHEEENDEVHLIFQL